MHNPLPFSQSTKEHLPTLVLSLLSNQKVAEFFHILSQLRNIGSPLLLIQFLLKYNFIQI